jgi:hypothetical protein
MMQCRDRDARTILLVCIKASLFVQHPTRDSLLCSVFKLNFNIISPQYSKAAKDTDIFAYIGVESVVDLCRR